MNRNEYTSNDTLSLVEYLKTDDIALYKNWCDPETQQGYNGIYFSSFEEFESRDSLRNRFFAMIRLSGTNEIIGSVGISPPETIPDLAIWIFKPYRKQGYGTLAFMLATKYAIEVLGITGLHAGAYPDNIGSRKMLEKCGYVPCPVGNIPEKHYITGENIIQMNYIWRERTTMSIIKTHDVTLYGSTGEYDIILRPLCDEHLPLLYKWCANPEVLYWTEGGEDIVRSYGAETVHAIYGGVSQNALCFLIEVNGVPIGECWLQKMNMPDVITMYPESADIRRIDMSIGEKAYWNKGIGTAFIRMMIDYAFNGEYVEVLHCFCEDYNNRSRRVWEKNGFALILSEELPQPQKGKLQHHFRLTRGEYIERRRAKIVQNRIFELPLTEIQPSQLYVSEGKLRLARDWFDPADKSKFDPIPVKLYNGKYLMTDGHTRAVLAALARWKNIPVTWDNDPLDMLAYAEDVKWCDEAGMRNAGDLTARIVSHKDYEYLWRRRCHYMEIPLSYAAIVARYGGLDGRNNAIILTDNAMLETAQLIQNDSVPFVKSVRVINLDETEDCSEIYTLQPNDLLILHIGIESWTGKHRIHSNAFDKPDGVAAKYICVRPTVTPQALLEGLNTPEELTWNVVKKYGSLPDSKTVCVTAKSGTDISLAPYAPFPIPYNTHKPGTNAYLPPAEVSYSVVPGSANGVIVVDITVGELRVYADLIDAFGLIDEPVTLCVENGEIVEITGGATAQRLKDELWKLPDNCRKIVELGIGLSRMTPSGIIGIDESIAGTCHFGIGNGSDNNAPIHLDVVIDDFNIE